MTGLDLTALVPPDARVVAIAGPVAVGKSTFARTLSAQLDHACRGRAEVVSTDGFLHPNRVLEARGLLERKGFPESYDLDGLAAFITKVRSDAPAIAVPEYSHAVFDVVDGRVIAAPRIVILEGVNALQPAVAALADVGIYLEADDASVIGWYVDRFVQLTQHARATGEGFYVRFASLDDDGVADMAHSVWDAINGPNLDHHIRPTRAQADLVVRKLADHQVHSIERTN